MKNPIYGVIGAGGHGRETMPLARDMLEQDDSLHSYELVFVVENLDANTLLNGYPVISMNDFLSREQKKFFNVAIGNSLVRERIANDCLASDAEPFSIQSRHSLVLDESVIGPGVILSPYCLVTSNVRIGSHFHGNMHSSIAHDCVIGDFVTFGPGARCNGNVVIENHAYIGSNAVIKQGTSSKPLRIGRQAVIGMGAVVTKDIAAGATVVGNPARPIEE
jgi:sugar O-acyltransferase (sialic acid O-acetyltransferase NeuD family)